MADLQEDRRTRGERMRVEVKKGVVTLSGVVRNAEVRLAAERSAQQSYGVREVNNLLQVSANSVAAT